MEGEAVDDALTVPLPSWARTLRELNVRDGRSKKAQVVRMLAIGEDVHIVGLSGMRAEIDSPCDGWISIMTSTKEVCLELPDGPWPLPSSDNLAPDAPGAAAVAGTMSQDVNEDAVSLYDPPLIRRGWAMTLVQVNVREGRSKRSELLGSLPVKTHIYIVEVVETRARINDPYEGWVSVVTPDRIPALETLEMEEDPPGVEEELEDVPPPPPPPPPPPVAEPAEGPSAELPPDPSEEVSKQKEVRIAETEPSSAQRSSSEDSDSSGSSKSSSDSSEAPQAVPKAQAKSSAPRPASTSSEDSASDSSSASESSQATSSSSPVKPASAEDSAPPAAASGENSSEEPGWWWTHLKAIVSKGESRLTEVVGQIPPGSTVFVLELRNERAFIREPFEGWTSLRSPSGQIVLSMEAPAHVEGDGDAHTEEAEAKAAEAETKSVEVSTPVPGRLHRASRSSAVEVVPVQAVEVEDPQEEPLEVEEERQDVKEAKLEEDIHDAKLEQEKTLKTGLPNHAETNKMLEMQKDGPKDSTKDGTIAAVRVWEPDTFDQDVDDLKKRFQKASEQQKAADASKSSKSARETPQQADPPVVDTTSAASRFDSTRSAPSVVDLPGPEVEPGEAEVGGVTGAVAETMVPMPTERMEAVRLPEAETPVVQKAADASKSARETLQQADSSVVDTISAASRFDSTRSAPSVVDLPGPAVEPGGTGDAKGLEDPLVDPLATVTSTTTTSVELRATPGGTAEVGGGTEGKDSPPGAGTAGVAGAVAETMVPMPTERTEAVRLPGAETPVVQKDKGLQPEWQVEQDSLLRRLEEQLKRVEDPTIDLGAIAAEPTAQVSMVAESLEGAVPAPFAAVATVPAIAAPSALVPPHPSDTSDPWPSLRLFGDEDVEQVATELLRRAADEEWRRGRGGAGAGQMPPVELGETSPRASEPPVAVGEGETSRMSLVGGGETGRMPPIGGGETSRMPLGGGGETSRMQHTPMKPCGGGETSWMPQTRSGEPTWMPHPSIPLCPVETAPGSPLRLQSAARRPKRDEPCSGPIPAWVYEGPSPDASPSSPPVVPRPRASPSRTAASSPGGDARSRTGGRGGGGNGGIGGIAGIGENMLRGPPQTDTSSGLVELQQLLKMQEQQLRRQVQLQEQQFQLQEMQLQQQEQQLQARRQEQQQQERLNEMRQNLKVLEQQEQRQRVVPKATLSRPGMPMGTSMLSPAAMQVPLAQQHQQQDLLSHILLLHQSAQLQQLRQVQTEQDRHLRELQQLQPPWQPDSSFAGYGTGRPNAPAETSPQIPVGGASGSGSGRGAGSAGYEESPAEMEEEPEEATELTQSASDASDLWHGLWRQHQGRPPSEFMASEQSKLASQSQVTSWSPTPTPSRSSAP